MRVLLDECAPRELKRFLSEAGHNCETVQEVGWSGIENGELLALAEARFDVLLTIDSNLKYQQNLSNRKIAIVVLLARSNRIESLRKYFGDCAAALEQVCPGEILIIGKTG